MNGFRTTSILFCPLGNVHCSAAEMKMQLKRSNELSRDTTKTLKLGMFI